MRCTERLCSGAGGDRTLSERGSWARGVGLVLLSCSTQQCWLGARGMFQGWDLDLGAARSAGWAFWAESQASGTVGPWARACSWGRGGEPRQRRGPSGGRATGQAKPAPGCLGGCAGAVCAAGCCLVAGSYLAGVDAALRVASTQVVGVDGPCVPPAAVAEADVDEVNLGLLQDIR